MLWGWWRLGRLGSLRGFVMGLLHPHLQLLDLVLQRSQSGTVGQNPKRVTHSQRGLSNRFCVCVCVCAPYGTVGQNPRKSHTVKEVFQTVFFFAPYGTVGQNPRKSHTQSKRSFKQIFCMCVCPLWHCWTESKKESHTVKEVFHTDF